VSAQHTPGPWRTDPDFARDVQSADGKIAIYSPFQCGDDRIKELRLFAPLRSEAEANARLIAAAPDLLAALRALTDWVEDQACFDDDLVNAARAAIASATGEA
jgi:hypothetical protein